MLLLLLATSSLQKRAPTMSIMHNMASRRSGFCLKNSYPACGLPKLFLCEIVCIGRGREVIAQQGASAFILIDLEKQGNQQASLCSASFAAAASVENSVAALMQRTNSCVCCHSCGGSYPGEGGGSQLAMIDEHSRRRLYVTYNGAAYLHQHLLACL